MRHRRYGWWSDRRDDWEDRVADDDMDGGPFDEVARELHDSLRLVVDEVVDAVTMPLEAFAASFEGGRRRRGRRRAWRFEAWAAGDRRRTEGWR